jgi:hypothetical protein
MTDNPWQTAAGRRARSVQFRALAAGDGTLAEFARDVVSGRARPRDLLYSSALAEQLLPDPEEFARRWHELSEEERAALGDPEDVTRQRIAALNTLADEPEPGGDDEDDEDDHGGWLRPAW